MLTIKQISIAEDTKEEMDDDTFINVFNNNCDSNNNEQ